MVEVIEYARDSLKTRLQLVDAALARLCVVADDLDEGDKQKGGDPSL